ncbi:hypothetical protein BGZ61DRAFT_442034 [Ilyonectria robusta]|uniref:uncharacterized protein n=1 Tax=Ilyonectria robusta TaxID=1079257 RepID=UPI001E8E6192|nr:uncharacterized protein BGZ61DRAFT_442034 [Ilyonectria robusta]KAH8736461.1 hypothetical protein BGZ61DRAFT_442034 [Ilyonectria robusta]
MLRAFTGSHYRQDVRSMESANMYVNTLALRPICIPFHVVYYQASRSKEYKTEPIILSGGSCLLSCLVINLRTRALTLTIQW